MMYPQPSTPPQSTPPAEPVVLAGVLVVVTGRTASLCAQLDHDTASAVLAAIYAGVADRRVALVEPPTDARLDAAAGLALLAADLADCATGLLEVAQPTREWTDLELDRLARLGGAVAAYRALVPR